MYIDNNRMVYERVQCDNCDGTGQREYNRLCPLMHKAVRAYGGKCPHCGSKNRNDHKTIGTYIDDCWSCDGTGIRQEDSTSTMPRDIFPALEFRVYRSNRRQTVNEYLLGLGCVSSVTDYGRHQKLTDAELIQKVKNDNTHVQASAIVNNADMLPSHIGIFCNDNGYSIKAVHESRTMA